MSKITQKQYQELALDYATLQKECKELKAQHQAEINGMHTDLENAQKEISLQIADYKSLTRKYNVLTDTQKRCSDAITDYQKTFEDDIRIKGYIKQEALLWKLKYKDSKKKLEYCKLPFWKKILLKFKKK